MSIDPSTKQALVAWLPPSTGSDDTAMDVETSNMAPTKPSQPLELVPESEVYIRLLFIHFLLTSPDTYPKAIQLSRETVEKIQQLNRRSMDPISAKVWYAVERAFELGSELAEARP